MGKSSNEKFHALYQSLHELQKGIDLHQSLLASLLGDRLEGCNLEAPQDLFPARSRELQLKRVIKEAIDVLEESRKAFKSKKLEALRKRLTEVLIDVD